MSTLQFVTQACPPDGCLPPSGQHTHGDEEKGRLGVMHQLLARGPQDEHLTGSPEITFFKDEWDTYLPFAMHQEEGSDGVFDRELSSPPYDGDRYPFFSGRSMLHVADIPRKGDMLNGVTLHIVLPKIRQGFVNGSEDRRVKTSWVESVAFSMIEYAQFSVDGQVLQTIPGQMIFLLSEVSPLGGRRRGYDEMTGKGKVFDGSEEVELYLPIPFWFCRQDDLSRPAFPLCSLRRGAKVQVTLRIRPWGEVVRTVQGGKTHTFPDLESSLCRARLICDFVWLEFDQRGLFNQARHEHLIEQTQHQVEIIEAANHDFKREILTSRPTKSIYFTLQDLQDITGDSVFGNRWMNTGTFDVNTQRAQAEAIRTGAFPPPMLTAQIYMSKEPREPLAPQLPGSNEESRAFYKFYSLLRPFYANGAIPRASGIYSYHFARFPFGIAPSGHYDLSTSTNLLHIRTSPEITRRLQLNIFTVSYNTLVFDQGEVSVSFID